MRYLKIILSVLFVLAVGFAVVRACAPHKAPVEKMSLPPAEAPAKRIVVAPPPAAASKVRFKMAIILDDWGLDYALTKDAVAMGRPLTLSILPHLKNSRAIAEEAYRNGLGVMLHMPMEPKAKGEPLEPHTIMTTTPDDTILAYLDAAVAGIPHVQGVNNHMGSAATSDERVMRVVLGRLKQKNLFFVDSEVTSTTVAPRVARQVGLPFTKRDVFIDNVKKLDPIEKQLARAEVIAEKRGRVVVIGHDKKVTLDAIKAMLPEFDRAGIELVLVRDLLGGKGK